MKPDWDGMDGFALDTSETLLAFTSSRMAVSLLPAAPEQLQLTSANPSAGCNLHCTLKASHRLHNEGNDTWWHGRFLRHFLVRPFWRRRRLYLRLLPQ